MTPTAANPDVEVTPQIPRVSVVVVTHNRKDTLVRLLGELGNQHQIIVVDNGSGDGTAQAVELDYPKVRFIRLPKNFGLTKALNIGIRAAEGACILLLHDDLLISGSAVDQLADALETHAEFGAVSPALTSETGGAMPQVRALPTLSDPDPAYIPDTTNAGECVLGAAIMFRTYFLRAVRQIDERYGTYGPDLELAWQVKKAGKSSAILPDVKAVHLALTSPVKSSVLAADRVAGTATYLGTHVGAGPGLIYRAKRGLTGLLTFRFSVAAGAFAGKKIDGGG